MKNKKRTGMILGMAVLTAAVWTGAAAPVKAETEKVEIKNTEIRYPFGTMTLKLPGDWKGRYETKPDKKNDAVKFYHRASRVAWKKEGEEDGGLLFTLRRSPNYDFIHPLANYYLAGSDEKYIYYLTIPGDMQGYEKNKRIAGEWLELAEDVPWIYRNAEAEYPGAPMRTLADVYFRKERSRESKSLGVFPEGEEVWVIGNFPEGWAEVVSDGRKGYVKEEYLEFVEPADREKEETSGDDSEPEKESGKDLGKEPEKEFEKEPGKEPEKEPEDETPQPEPEFRECVLYDGSGNALFIQQAEDGYWYDGNGVNYGFWTDIRMAFDAGVPVSNGNGELFYWTAGEHGEEEIPIQGEVSAMLYDENGNSMQIHMYDGCWYGDDGRYYGATGEIELGGAPVTDASGKVWYWTYQG